MTDIQIVILFNGTSNDDKDPAVTNVVKLRDGLKKDDTQFVIYRDGVGNDQEWHWKIARYFSEITGYGGGWIMRKAYQELKSTISKAISDGKIKSGDRLNISVGGFSRGAAIARHFAIHNIQNQLASEMPQMLENISIKLESEYLFDTVTSFGIPINIWALTKLGIYNQQIDPGWDFGIPENVRAYQTLGMDEHRDAFSPLSINQHNELTQEVWFEGDHSSVGGGHLPPKEGAVMQDANTLRYMVRRAMENGLRFKQSFLEEHHIHATQGNPLGFIKAPLYKELPPTQRSDRKIGVLENDMPSNKPPLIAQSAIERLHEDFEYRPANLKALKAFDVLREDGSVESYSPKKVQKLWTSLESKVLRFSTDNSKEEKVASHEVELRRKRMAKS